MAKELARDLARELARDLASPRLWQAFASLRARDVRRHLSDISRLGLSALVGVSAGFAILGAVGGALLMMFAMTWMAAIVADDVVSSADATLGAEAFE